MTTEEAISVIQKYKAIAITSLGPENKLGNYNHGVANGLEIALSILESRPMFLVNEKGQYNKYDMQQHPEYFV